MSNQGFLYVMIASLFTFTSNFLLRAGIKRAGGFTPAPGTFLSSLAQLGRQPFFLSGLLLYIAGALIWFRIVSTENMNTSYPVLVGMTFFLVTLGSVFILREHISVLKVIGLSLIFVGILVISRA